MNHVSKSYKFYHTCYVPAETDSIFGTICMMKRCTYSVNILFVEDSEYYKIDKIIIDNADAFPLHLLKSLTGTTAFIKAIISESNLIDSIKYFHQIHKYEICWGHTNRIEVNNDTVIMHTIYREYGYYDIPELEKYYNELEYSIKILKEQFAIDRYKHAIIKICDYNGYSKELYNYEDDKLYTKLYGFWIHDINNDHLTKAELSSVICKLKNGIM